jgi:hypothetical protein
MKRPKYFVQGVQECINAGLNGFALQLMAESFADDPAKFGDESVILTADSHKGQTVYFVMTKECPSEKDFDTAPTASAP